MYGEIESLLSSFFRNGISIVGWICVCLLITHGLSRDGWMLLLLRVRSLVCVRHVPHPSVVNIRELYMAFFT